MSDYKDSGQDELLTMMEEMQDEIERLRSENAGLQQENGMLSEAQKQISDLSSQTLMLKNKISEMQSNHRSEIANLKEELSSTQRINQSLTKNNRLLTQSNDDLRNNAGLLSRKEQEKIIAELTDTQARLSEAEKKIDMSNVKAVMDAQRAQKNAEQKARKQIADCKRTAEKKISDALTDRNAAVCAAKKEVDSAKKSLKTSRLSLLITLLCCLIANPAFIWSVRDFIIVPAKWILDKLYDYAVWMEKPYHTRTVFDTVQKIPFPTGWAWVLRTVTFILIMGSLAVVFSVLYHIARYYKKRWCNLSSKVLLTSLGVVIVFGDLIYAYVRINLVLLIFIIQLLYLCVLAYLDRLFENRFLLDEWKELQNS